MPVREQAPADAARVDGKTNEVRREAALPYP